MKFNNWMRIGFVLFLCITLPGCGPAFIHDRAKFRPEQITCHVKAIPGARARIKAISEQPMGMLYVMDNIDSILADMKYWADRGDPSAMMRYGGLKQEFIIGGLMKGMGGLFWPSPPAGPYLPEQQHNNMVMALSYLYISASIGWSEQEKAAKIIQRIEKNRSDLASPPQWIVEAKANARNWQEHCHRL